MPGRVFATAGAKLSIGPIFSATVDTLTEFAALSYTQVNAVSSIGDFGDTSQEITFDVIDETRTRKAKGTRNGGTLSVVMAFDLTDTGQQALVTAFASQSAYAFRVEFADKLTGPGVNSAVFFYGKVMSNVVNAGGANDITRRTCTIGVDSDQYFRVPT
jgi:hypothetical protein